PVNDIVVDPDLANTFYAATDIGVFASSTGGTSWAPLGTGLPRTTIVALNLHHASRTLRAGSHGRSAWDIDVSTGVTVPSITSISPSTAMAGGPAFTLTVNGSGYTNTSTVQWNGLS